MRRIHGTNIYNGFVPTLAQDRQGWNSEHTSFEEIIRGLRPNVVIDVGVWKGAQDRIVPLAETSTVAGKLLRRLGIHAGMIHIDTSHDDEDVPRDARTYWESLTPGGFLGSDDYNEDWPNVIKAANHFAAEKSTQVISSKPKWIVRRAP